MVNSQVISRLKSKISRLKKKLPVIGAVVVATHVGSPKGMAQNSDSPLLARTEAAMMNFSPELNDRINELAGESFETEYKDFPQEVARALGENIGRILKAVKNGTKSRTLKKMFGNDINTKFYCAGGALRTVLKISEASDYNECSAILKQIENPQSCLSVIEGLSEAYGDECRTNNMYVTLCRKFKENPNSVLIAVVHSKSNTSSGRHLVIVTPKFAADTMVTSNNLPEGTVYSMNSEQITDMKKYCGTHKKGNVYDLSEMIRLLKREELLKLYIDGKLDLSPGSGRHATSGVTHRTRPFREERGRL